MITFKKLLLPAYLLATLTLLALYNLMDGAPAAYLATALISATATGVGVLVHRPTQRLPWLLLTAGMFIWAIGDLFWFAPGIAGPDTYPAAADVLYLIGYPFFIIALGILVWAGDKDFRKAGLLDVAMITIAIGMIVWIRGVAPTTDQGMLNLSFFTSAIYLILDLLLVGVAVKLLLTRSRRTVSSAALTLGLLTLLIADLASWFFIPGEGTLVMFLMDSSWLISYIAVGAAALHPSMAADSRASVEPPEHLTTLRMVLLGAVAVFAPMILIPHFLDHGEIGLFGVSIGIALFFILTLLRMSELFHHTQQVNRELEAKSEELRQEELRSRTIVEQTPAVTFIRQAAAPRLLRFISPQSRSVLGYEPDELTDVPDVMANIVHTDDLDRLEAMIDLRQPGVEISTDLRLVHKDGSAIWTHVQAKLIDGPNGLEWHGLLLDISARERVKELQSALQREQDAVERLEKLDDMKNTFLQAVSHELRTPLTTVRGLAATLRARIDRLGPEQVADIVNRIDSGAERLQSLLSDLLDVDRLSRGVFMPTYVQSDVGQLVSRTARRILAENDLIQIDANSELAWVDPSKIERIVENLCANARKHTPSGTRIWVSVGSVGDDVLIEVSDSGLGVPNEIKESIFDPFNQGLSASAHSQGLGLGLSLVRKFAELHGGRSWVEDRKGGGACFKVSLPRVRVLQPEELEVLPEHLKDEITDPELVFTRLDEAEGRTRQG